MKKTILHLVVSGLFLFGCATSNNTMQNNVKKDTYMEVKTFEEYMKQKKFVLPVCKDKKYDGIIFLKDNTKVEYSCPLNKDDLIGETITSSKYPFVNFLKRYYSDTKSLAVIYTKISNIDIGKYRHYDKHDKLIKEIDYKQKSNLPYSVILQSLEKLGYLDLKNVRVLKGGESFGLKYLMNEDIDEEYEPIRTLLKNASTETKQRFKNTAGMWVAIFGVESSNRYDDTKLINLVFDDKEGHLLGTYITRGIDISELPMPMPGN